MFIGLQSLYVDIGRLVRAYHHPDPRFMKMYQIETGFYRAEDPRLKWHGRYNVGKRLIGKQVRRPWARE